MRRLPCGEQRASLLSSCGGLQASLPWRGLRLRGPLAARPPCGVQRVEPLLSASRSLASSFASLPNYTSLSLCCSVCSSAHGLLC